MDDVRREKPHQGQIMDLQTNKDLTFVISSSKDCTAKVRRILFEIIVIRLLFILLVI